MKWLPSASIWNTLAKAPSCRGRMQVMKNQLCIARRCCVVQILVLWRNAGREQAGKGETTSFGICPVSEFEPKSRSSTWIGGLSGELSFAYCLSDSDKCMSAALNGLLQIAQLGRQGAPCVSVLMGNTKHMSTVAHNSSP